MFKLTFALLLLVSGCQAQCTSDSCGVTDSLQMQMRVIRQRLDELTLENKKQTATIEGQENINQELRTTTGRLETTDAELRTTIEQLRSTNEQLRSTNEQLRSTNEQLRSTNEQLRSTNEELQTAVNSLQMNISHIQTTSTDLRTTNDQLRETVSSLQRNVTQMQTTSPASAVYFSVAANREIIYNGGDIVKFAHTFTNKVPAGSTGGWDAATNKYTCPITGDYMFVVTLFKGTGADYENFDATLTHTSLSGADTYIIYLNNVESSSVSGHIRFSSTTQAIVPCAEGEKVWVRADCNGCGLYDNSRRHNTFIGLKL